MFKNIVLCCSIVFISCCASNGTRGVDQSILDYQQQVSELEARNNDLANRLKQYDTTVANSIDQLTGIGRRAAQMGSDIDTIISLFGQYQQEVERLVQAYRQLQSKSN